MVNKRFKCQFCLKKFSDSFKWLTHESRHREKKSFICSICSKGFKSQSKFDQHVNKHFDESYNCKICFKEFETSNYLKQHLLTHKKKDEGKKFKCECCPKVFSNREGFVTHTLKHRDDEFMKQKKKKPTKSKYNCHHCKKVFKNQDGFVTHMIKHKDDKKMLDDIPTLDLINRSSKNTIQCRFSLPFDANESSDEVGSLKRHYLRVRSLPTGVYKINSDISSSELSHSSNSRMDPLYLSESDRYNGSRDDDEQSVICLSDDEDIFGGHFDFDRFLTDIISKKKKEQFMKSFNLRPSVPIFCSNTVLKTVSCPDELNYMLGARVVLSQKLNDTLKVTLC